MTYPSTSPQYGFQIVETMKKIPEATYLICSFHNVDFLELVDEHKPTHEKPFLDSVDFVLSRPPRNVRSTRNDVNSHYGVLPPQIMMDDLALCRRLVRQR